MSVVRRLPTMGGLGRKFLHKLPDLETLRNLESPFIYWIQLDIYFLASTSYSQTYSEAGLAQSRMWPAGTLCITIAANIGMTGILAFNACFPDSVVGFAPNNLVTVEYIQTSLDLIQRHIEENAPQAAQRNINLRILRQLEIPVPPYFLQRRYSELVTFARQMASSTLNAADTASRRSGSLVSQLLGPVPDPFKCSGEHALENI